MNRVLVLTDNINVFERFKKIYQKKNRLDVEFCFFCSPSSEEMFLNHHDVNVLDIKKEYLNVIDNYSLVISCHCKKIFPADLVNSIRCINIHPGLNPYNRGWYPQVFAINNKMPHGATIHLMDEEIDHGEIIAQEEISIESFDTSLTVYEKVLDAEISLFDEYYDHIVDETYSSKKMITEGNYNSIRDFATLCNLDINKQGTLKEHIDLLRSLTHGEYQNAYFYSEAGVKIYISVNLNRCN